MELGIDEKTLRKIGPFFVPVGTMLATLIFTYFFANYFWGKIKEVRNNIEVDTRERNVLQEKLNVLRSNQVGIIETQNVVATALPIYSSSSLMLNQLVNLQNKYQTPITDLQIRDTGAEDNDASEVYIVDVQFTLSGTYTQTALFLSELTRLSPIIKFKEIAMEATRVGLDSEVRLLSFYSKPPETIPAISDPIEDLDDSEKGVVSVIKEYTQPTIEEAIVVEAPKGKENPFLLEGI